MPISTLCAKSMPSTNSRKPCTKCWRDCSPSLTTSMLASSCALSASKVASRLPAASSSPCSFHGAHSLLGSASHAGFGRLPATVVGKSCAILSLGGLVEPDIRVADDDREPVGFVVDESAELGRCIGDDFRA